MIFFFGDGKEDLVACVSAFALFGVNMCFYVRFGGEGVHLTSVVLTELCASSFFFFFPMLVSI